MNKKELLTKLDLPDAFNGFVPIPDTKLWGWNGNSPILSHLVNQVKPTLVLEIGSWMGQSAVTFAKSCEAAGLSDSSVICVDTWLGSKEHWADPELRNHMELQNGYPTFYKRFLTNMVNSSVQNRVVPLPMPSSIALSFLKDKDVHPELIYVDGSHETKDVFDDLMGAWEILKPGGTIFGDDVPWKSVMDAVKAFASEKGCPYSVHEINWIVRKPV